MKPRPNIPHGWSLKPKLLPEGEYTGVVESWEAKISTRGQGYQLLKIKVDTPDSNYVWGSNWRAPIIETGDKVKFTAKLFIDLEGEAHLQTTTIIKE